MPQKAMTGPTHLTWDGLSQVEQVQGRRGETGRCGWGWKGHEASRRKGGAGPAKVSSGWVASVSLSQWSGSPGRSEPCGSSPYVESRRVRAPERRLLSMSLTSPPAGRWV